jgi:excisionase family DNA binding protein
MDKLKSSQIIKEGQLPRLAYTLQETAAILGVSSVTIHRLIKRGALRSSSALRHKLIPATEIQRFLESSLEKDRR